MGLSYTNVILYNVEQQAVLNVLRKRGEDEEGFGEVTERDFAAPLISSVYLQEPHNTHLKQYLFGSNYARIFSRKTSAEKIFLAKLIFDTVDQNSDLLQNEKIRECGLALFFFAHVIVDILREDELGKSIMENPKIYVTTDKERLYKGNL